MREPVRFYQRSLGASKRLPRLVVERWNFERRCVLWWCHLVVVYQTAFRDQSVRRHCRWCRLQVKIHN